MKQPKRCYQCHGRFGLMRRTYHLHQFCSAHCLRSYKLYLNVELARRRWLGWLYRPIS
jgi:hypothetical protein